MRECKFVESTSRTINKSSCLDHHEELKPWEFFLSSYDNVLLKQAMTLYLLKSGASQCKLSAKRWLLINHHSLGIWRFFLPNFKSFIKWPSFYARILPWTSLNYSECISSHHHVLHMSANVSICLSACPCLIVPTHQQEQPWWNSLTIIE